MRRFSTASENGSRRDSPESVRDVKGIVEVAKGGTPTTQWRSTHEPRQKPKDEDRGVVLRENDRDLKDDENEEAPDEDGHATDMRNLL